MRRDSQKRSRPPPTPGWGPVARPENGSAHRHGSRNGSSRAGWRELLRTSVDERVRCLSHRGAVEFKTNFRPY